MRRDESGAVAVVAALTLVMLLGFAAFAIDLAQLRVDRAAGQSAADMAAAAGALAYDPGAADGAVEACEEAVAYAEVNLGATLTPEVSCDVWAGEPPCTLREARYRSDPFVVTITIPVDDGSALMGSQALVPEFDGTACDRVGVRVDRDRTLLFAAAGRVGDSDSGTQMSAVGRHTSTGDGGEYASLIVLHPSECQALEAGGAGPHEAGVRVQGFTDPVTSEYYPGVITVDSLNNSCTNPKQIIRANGGGEVFAQDKILSYQLLAGTQPSAAYGGSGTIHTGVPPNDPEGGKRVTRQPVDHLKNCLASYPNDQLWSPTHPDSVSTAGPCEDAGKVPPYIRTLHARYQTLDFADQADANANGWNYLSGAGCGGTAVHGPAARQGTTDGRRWFLDCPGVAPGNSGFTPDDVHFDGVDAVVTKGQIRLQNDVLRITGSTDRGAVLYVQAGDLRLGNADVNFADTFVYLQNGHLTMGSASLQWVAPYAVPPATCATYDAAFVHASTTNSAPPASCLAPLALWTNSGDLHKLGGGGTTVVEGSFFTPNAQPFNVQGGAGSNYTKAQFFSATLLFGGSGKVDMVPNPDTNIAIPLTGGGLIR